MAHRQIFLHGPLGQRHLKEVISGHIAGLFLKPEKIWLVSPWLSDFKVLDNKTGDWETLNPSWGKREISFLELIADVVNNGCSLRMVTQDDGKSKSFVQQLENRLVPSADYKYLENQVLHTKGFLTREFFLKGSMNYTYRGANLNDEVIELTNDATMISEAFLEFKDRYKFEDNLCKTNG